VTALRETLAESESRGRDLQREMAERERAQAQLIHAQKLEATGRLASGIAHDFGNLLDVILGFARQRHDAGDLPDARQSRDALADSLEGVETAARRGTAITRKLLGFSRADLLKPQTFDLRDAVADLQPMLRQLFPPSVRLSLETGDTPLPVYIDRSELEMMLLNVAANARDALPDGGRFDVRVRDAGDMAGVSLSDSGHGMDAQVLRQIFEPFFSTKNAAEGTGLGLSVIQDLVRAVGGDIHVDSAIGRGTTFVIRLPRAGEAAQAPALNT
jgi:signal transduction histidine kinase